MSETQAYPVEGHLIVLDKVDSNDKNMGKYFTPSGADVRIRINGISKV